MEPFIGHVYVLLIIQGNPTGPSELAIAFACGSKFQ